MSKKKKPNPPKKQNKTRNVLLVIGIAVAIVAISVGIALWIIGDDDQGSVSRLPGDSTTQYNTAATERAWAAGQIAKNEILVQETIEKKLGGDTRMTFHIYRLPEGADPADYLGLEVSKIPENTPLVLMGTASCRFLGDKLTSIYGLNISYTR